MCSKQFADETNPNSTPAPGHDDRDDKPTRDVSGDDDFVASETSLLVPNGSLCTAKKSNRGENNNFPLARGRSSENRRSGSVTVRKHLRDGCSPDENHGSYCMLLRTNVIFEKKEQEGEATCSAASVIRKGSPPILKTSSTSSDDSSCCPRRKSAGETSV